MGKNIVVLAGSPRAKSTSGMLAEAFIDGAKSAGHEVTLFRVARMKIGGCLACEHCFVEQGVCIQKDEMPQILGALRLADTIVLAAPVYFWGVTSQLKQAIDRTYALLKEGNPIERAVLLMTCGNAGEDTAQPSIDMFRRICAYQKWIEAGIIVAAGVNEPDELAGRPELEQANKLGAEI